MKKAPPTLRSLFVRYRLQLLVGFCLVCALAATYGILEFSSENQALRDQLAVAQQTTVSGSASTAAPYSSAATPTPAVAANSVPAVTAADHILGAVTAPVALVEYGDLECPFCKKSHSTLLQLHNEYGDKLAIVFRNYPLDIHPAAPMEGQVAECVAQGNGNDEYWHFIDTVFGRSQSTGSSFTQAQMLSIVKELGYDNAATTSCVSSGGGKARLDRDIAQGNALKINETPTAYAIGKNGVTKLIVGALVIDSYRSIIDGLLQ